jgi:hypothetical protein
LEIAWKIAWNFNGNLLEKLLGILMENCLKFNGKLLGILMEICLEF